MKEPLLAKKVTNRTELWELWDKYQEWKTLSQERELSFDEECMMKHLYQKFMNDWNNLQ